MYINITISKVGQPTVPGGTAATVTAQQPQQQQVAAHVLFTDADVKEIQEMFTNMDVEVIKSVMYVRETWSQRGHRQCPAHNDGRRQ